MLILKILATCLLTAISAISYRFGGSSHGIRWVRQIGVATALLACLTVWCGWNWWGLLIYGLIWVESTYFKWKGNTNFFTWCLVGLSFSLIPLPYLITGHGHWKGFFIRMAVLTPAIGLVDTIIGDVQWSEGLRGGLQIITLPLLLL